uniref:Uncharacterized protein n=1 Tax=Anguilla anguilla TaxID=7936 RepID=A0A0E9S6I0_ANGAN
MLATAPILVWSLVGSAGVCCCSWPCSVVWLVNLEPTVAHKF